jgi:O-antigen/teichoic acid export membrane protein
MKERLDESMSDVTRKTVIDQLIKGGGTSILIKVASAGLAYLMLFVIARASTAEQYGIFAVAYSIAFTVSFVSTIGQSHTIMRFWPQWMGQDKPLKARAALKLSMIVTSVGLSLTVVLMLLGGTLEFFMDVPWSLGIAGAAALFGFVMGWAEFAAAGMRAQEYVFKAQAPRDIGWRLLLCLAFGAAAIAGMSIDAETIILVATGILVLMVVPQVVALIRSIQGASLKDLVDEDRGQFRKFTLNLWALASLGAARNYAGVIIVSTFLGPVAAGAYFVADRTANLLSFLLLAINMVTAPLISKHHHSGRPEMVRLIVALSGIVGGLSAFCGLLFLAFLGAEILSLFDPSYIDYLPVLFILAFGQFIRTATGPSGLLLMMSGYERVNLILLVTIGPASVALQILGGLYFGPIGVASATTGGIICIRCATAIYAWRVLDIDSTGVSMVVHSLRNWRRVLRET